MSELHIWATPIGVRAGYYVINPDSTELFVDYHDHKHEVAELEAERERLREQCLKWSGMYRGLLDEIMPLKEDTHE